MTENQCFWLLTVDYLLLVSCLGDSEMDVVKKKSGSISDEGK